MSSTKNKRLYGSMYEDVAVKYLLEKGYFIIQRNFRCHMGEIDIIARDGQTIVFVEVKYRKNTASGHPLESVTLAKQKKISQVALAYMNLNRISVYNTMIRFDVIGICGDEIQHIENAFMYGGGSF